MNILFYRYGSICEDDFLIAFREYGINVKEITEEVYIKTVTPARCSEIVGKELQNGNYTFVFSINFFTVVSDVCNIYKIPYMSIVVDSPVLELYSNSISNPYNRLFLFDKAQYEEFVHRNPEHIYHIPLCTNVNRWDKVINSSDSKDFYSDVSFVGSLYTEKCLYDRLHDVPDYLDGWLNGIIEAQLRIYGYYFVDNLITDEIADEFMRHIKNPYKFPPNYSENYKALVSQFYIGNKITAVERVRLFQSICQQFNVDIYTASDTSGIINIHNKGLAKSHTEMPLIYNRSKINLNTTSKAIRKGLPLRIFDIMGCRGFVLTNYQEELPEIFNIGEHLDIYESFDDLRDKIDYYINHPDIRKEMAYSGYECVKEKHTYTIRLGEMIVKAFGNIF